MLSSDTSLSNFYSRRKVLVVGGTGFIGVSLVVALRSLGADITVMSRGLTEAAGSFPEDVAVRRLDISSITPSSAHDLGQALKECDIVFDLAGQSGALSSTHGPFADLQSNVVGQCNLLETCRIANPDARIVFLSTRLVYGKANCLPVTEEHATEPTSFYGVNKLTAEKYHRLYHEIHGTKTSILRVTLPYGPRQPARVYSHGIVNLFIEKASQNEPILIYGDGEQERDVIHIADLVRAILTVALAKETIGQIYNLGSGTGVSLSAIAKCVCEAFGQGSVEHIPWPKDAQAIETGDFVCSIDKMTSQINWKPEISLVTGLRMCAESLERNSGLAR